MTPREVVLEAVNHRETDIIPYALSIHAEIWEKLDAHYGGRENVPAHETFLAGHGADWKGNETLPNNQFRDRFGTLWVQGNIFRMVEPTLKEPSLAGYEFPDRSSPPSATSSSSASWSCTWRGWTRSCICPSSRCASATTSAASGARSWA